jgi:hypothetical protein
MSDNVTDAIENNEVFAEGTRGTKQIPIKYQLMVLLHFIGKEGGINVVMGRTRNILVGVFRL